MFPSRRICLPSCLPLHSQPRRDLLRSTGAESAPGPVNSPARRPPSPPRGSVSRLLRRRPAVHAHQHARFAHARPHLRRRDPDSRFPDRDGHLDNVVLVRLARRLRLRVRRLLRRPHRPFRQPHRERPVRAGWGDLHPVEDRWGNTLHGGRVGFFGLAWQAELLNLDAGVGLLPRLQRGGR